jgi:hypothetical protein
MDDEQPPLIAPESEDARDRSLIDDLRQLAADGRVLLEAELAYHKSRAVVAGAGAKGIAGWLALALALIFFALMALVLGLVLVLAEQIGALGATVAATIVLLIAAALAGWAAKRRWDRMAQAFADSDDAPDTQS